MTTAASIPHTVPQSETRTPSPTSDPTSNPRLNPLTLWHLLSLDAPTVATLWTWFIASANHVRLPASALMAMAAVVWMLYAADRILDARILDARILDAHILDAHISDAQILDAQIFNAPHLNAAPKPPLHSEELEARHHFHFLHRRAFLLGILFASIASAILLPRLEAASIHLYLFLGGLLAGYFILIHATRSPADSSHKAHRFPKEIAVGIFFAAAIFIPTVARHPDLRTALLSPALLFAALCSLNCLFIYAWEHPAPNPAAAPSPSPSTSPGLRLAHPTTRLALRHLRSLAIGIAIAAVLLCLADLARPSTNPQAPWQIPAACALSTLLLLLLHRQRRTLSALNLRAAADLALLTPILFLFFPQ